MKNLRKDFCAISSEAIGNCPSVIRGKSPKGFAISSEAIGNCPSVIRGKSKKTRGLFL